MDFETKTAIITAVRLIAKTMLVLLTAFCLVFAMNVKMAAYLSEEAALQRAALRDMLPKEIAYNTPDVHYIGQFNELYEQNIRADVMIVGTSHANRAVNPYYLEQESDLKFFNFAMDGACPSYYLDWWEQAVIPSGYPVPKLIIYSVDWFMFDNNWLWRRIEQDYKFMREVSASDENEDAGQTLNWSLLAELDWTDIDEVTTVLFNRVPIIYARDKIFEMFGTPTLPQTAGDALSIEDCPYYNGHLAIEGNYDGKRVSANCSVMQSEIDDFKTLVKTWREMGIPVLFLMVPEYLEGRRAPKYDRQIQLLNEIAAELDVDFINYNEEYLTEYSLSADYYYDWGHMNWYGSALYSRVLQQDLQPFLQKYING